ncbi:hypothetical protein ACHAWF_001274 [Thalassiosira exigua]
MATATEAADSARARIVGGTTRKRRPAGRRSLAAAAASPLLLSALLAAPSSLAFAPPSALAGTPRRATTATPAAGALGSASSDDCACEGTAAAAAMISGAPAPEALAVDPRAALASSSVVRLDGSRFDLGDLLPPRSREEGSKASLIEQILRYSELRESLLASDVSFGVVSIGTPETGTKLMEHLGIDDGGEWIYADPENEAYDNLKLNRGWDTMARPATAFAFKDRIFGDGQPLDQLFEVLGKWKDAVYVPPKIEQSTNHGGTFVFDGEGNTVLAHYDESPGTHYDPDKAAKAAIEAAKTAANEVSSEA